LAVSPPRVARQHHGPLRPEPSFFAACDAALSRASKERALFRCSESTWWTLLDLGSLYGWVPAGPAFPPDSRQGELPYQPDSGQLVRAEDALNLAAALGRASAQRERVDHKTLEVDWRAVADGAAAVGFGDHALIAEALGELYRADSVVEEFAAFCRGGAFRLG